jgi:hypothetical protein
VGGPRKNFSISLDMSLIPLDRSRRGELNGVKISKIVQAEFE